MASYAGNLGPVGAQSNRPLVDQGTLARFASPLPGALGRDDDRQLFESAYDLLRAEIANAGTHAAIDGATRARYDQLLQQFRAEILHKVSAGQLSWRAAAEEAHGIRNEVMELLRGRSTPVGKALAQRMKGKGKSLNTLIAEKAVQQHGPGANFGKLSGVEKNKVYAAIVESSGKSRPSLTARMQTVSRAGRALIVVSLALSAYNIAVAEDKVDASKREVAITGAGVAGGIAGGALAGLACGPGAPVCVTVGAFVGGALAALGVDWMW